MSIKATSIDGNRQWLDGGSMFGNAPRPVWEKWIAPDAVGRIPLACRSLLLELNGKKILCETGIGAFFDPKMAERFGVESPDEHKLLTHLNAKNISEDEIDFVILSHLHFDHAGGLLPPFASTNGKPTKLLFRNARYVVGNTAWQRALRPHSRDKASFIPGLTDLLLESGRLILVEGTSHTEVHPEHISFFYSDGHTPGQMLTLCRGQSESIVFTGDLIPGTPWVHLPISMGYDRYPELLIDEKETLYGLEGLEKRWFFFTHDPKYSAARVVKNEKGRYEPKDSQVQLNALTI